MKSRPAMSSTRHGRERGLFGLRPRGAVPGLALIVSLLGLLGTAGAQDGLNFNANTYYQQCLRFEAGGDLVTARQSCLNALQIDPDFALAELSLARINLGLGNLAEAESGLRRIESVFQTAEPHILLAEVALRRENYVEASGHLATARARLSTQYNSDLEARRHYLEGLLAERQGRYETALASYGEAIAADSLDPGYRLAEANLLYRMGKLQEARAEITSYQQFAGDDQNPDLLSLLGRIDWAMGDLEGAANTLESAVLNRSGNDGEAHAADLRYLALIYYGQGDLRSGGLALEAALEHGDLLSLSLQHLLPWLLVMVVLLALHLIGESRIDSHSTLEVSEGPELWSVGQVYGVLITSLLLALVSAVVYGNMVYGNYLAIATPVQSAEVRALFFAVLAVLLVAFSLLRARAKGWAPWETLLGGSGSFWPGFGLGLLFIGLVLGLLAYGPDWPWLRGFYLDLSNLTPLMVAAIVVIPLFELFFRAFAIPALSERYTQGMAVVISAALFTLVFGSPVALLLALGLILSEIYRRRPSGLTPLVAQLTLHLGLVLFIAFSGWARALFL